jgi:hypothetical protein
MYFKMIYRARGVMRRAKNSTASKTQLIKPENKAYQYAKEAVHRLSTSPSESSYINNH